MSLRKRIRHRRRHILILWVTGFFFFFRVSKWRVRLKSEEMRDIIRRQTTTRQKRSAGRFCIIWIQFEWRTFLAIMCVCLVVSILPCVCMCLCAYLNNVFILTFLSKIFFLFSSQCQNKKKKKCLYLITLSVSERPTARLFYFPKKFYKQTKKQKQKRHGIFSRLLVKFLISFPLSFFSLPLNGK